MKLILNRQTAEGAIVQEFRDLPPHIVEALAGVLEAAGIDAGARTLSVTLIPGAGQNETLPHYRVIARGPLIAAMTASGWIQNRAGRLLGLTGRQVEWALMRHGIPAGGPSMIPGALSVRGRRSSPDLLRGHHPPVDRPQPTNRAGNAGDEVHHMGLLGGGDRVVAEREGGGEKRHHGAPEGL